MQKLVRGVHHFRQHVFSSEQELFERLSKGQHPETLFITCSDSRINPNLITQTRPGELFILRNAGNIIPPFSLGGSGEIATIEYAVAALGVRDIIVCGHTLCGAMDALLNPSLVQDLPAVAAWLQHAEATRRIIRENYGHLKDRALFNATVQENVLVQLEHLRSLPAVAPRLAAGKVHLHGWVYKLETGEVFVYQGETGEYVLLTDSTVIGSPPPARPATVHPI